MNSQFRYQLTQGTEWVLPTIKLALFDYHHVEQKTSQDAKDCWIFAREVIFSSSFVSRAHTLIDQHRS
jgi:hypothetical protein